MVLSGDEFRTAVKEMLRRTSAGNQFKGGNMRSPSSILVSALGAFFLDYFRDRARYCGAVFWWDENGNWQQL